MEKLHHNGVLVPPRYKGKKLTVKVKGKETRLTTEQEEMAVAWAKKGGTPYVEDPVFAKNFHKDFSTKIGTEVKLGDVDYSEIISLVEKERERKKKLPREEKKLLAAQRKVVREANNNITVTPWLTMNARSWLITSQSPAPFSWDEENIPYEEAGKRDPVRKTLY